MFEMIEKIVFLIAVLFLMIDNIIEREKNTKEREFEYAQFKNQVDVYKTLDECLKRQQQYSHEFKNHIMCVDSLVRERDYAALEKYISELYESEYIEERAIDTNNTIVNAILNEKYHEMINKGIVFVFRINDLSAINIEEQDLAVILYNLLNNAIEACEKCVEEKIIRLKFMIEDDMIILSVNNTCSEPVIYENGFYKTSKTLNKNEHGIGINNIQRTIEKYDRTYSIRYSQKEFYFAILFHLSQTA